MYRKRHRRGRRLASVILAAVMVTTAIPAQAAEFGAPENLEDIFSSGEEDSVTGTDEQQRLHHRKQEHRIQHLQYRKERLPRQ